jgi:hypothetical protein
VDERIIVPWYQCKQENRAWQEQRVRELGYSPYCENLDSRILSVSSVRYESRGWPFPLVKAAQQAAKEGCQSCDLLCRVIDDCGLAFNLEDAIIMLDIGSFNLDRCVASDSDRFVVTVRMNLKSSEAVQISRLREGIVPLECCHMLPLPLESV